VRHAPPTRVLTAVVIAGLLLAAGPASAGPASDRLRDFFGRVNVVLADEKAEPLDKVARVKHLVTDIADVRGAAAAALDAQWHARSVAEREEFARLFAELLERGFVARLAGTVSPVNGMVMAFRGETRVGDEARVATEVETRDGRKVIVEYRMSDRRGRWLVHDVVVDGISTVDNYRAQFRRLLRHGSYADLVASLRAKLGEETLMFAQASPPAVARATERPDDAAVSRPAPAAPRGPVARTPAPGVKAPAVAKTPVPVAKAPAVTRTPAPPPSTTRWIAVAPAPVAPPGPSPAPPAARTPQWIAAVPDRPARAVVPARPPAARVPAVRTVTRPMSQTADVISPLAALDSGGLPSALLVTLGLAGVTASVYLRRRAS
jgi:phospholipid transport system substrate-binding protein